MIPIAPWARNALLALAALYLVPPAVLVMSWVLTPWLGEWGGWAEPQIVIRFWIISLILAMIGLATLKVR